VASRPSPGSDERVRQVSPLRRLAARPDLGALVGAVVIFAFFAAQSEVFRSPTGIANWLYPASTLGIMAVAVSLLMIGGEFDLSAGVLTGSAGLVTAIMTTTYGVNVWVALSVSLGLAVCVGILNGVLVTKTRLPSLIATLATFLLLQGINLGGTKLLTDTTQVSGLSRVPGFEPVRVLLASTISIAGAEFPISIAWWIAITAVALYILNRSVFGNWILASGGDAIAARNAGVPVKRTKITLFITVSVCTWLTGNLIMARVDAVQSTTGIGVELIYVVAAVIGGCLLTGGLGSPLGAAVGALIFGMAQIGIIYVGWDADWFKAFLGAMLLLAVLTNGLVKRFAVRGAFA